MNSKVKNSIFTTVLVIVAVFLIGCTGGGATSSDESLTDVLGKAKDVVAYRYTAVITAPGQPAMTAKFWLKENKMRWEGTAEGQSIVYLIDEDAQTAHLYIPAQNMAMKMSWNQAQETVGDSPAEQSESILQYNPVTVGTENLSGKRCLVVEYTDRTGTVKSWIWTKYGFPIKVETTTAQGTTVVELKNINFGSISDSMFELPAGVQSMQIPSIQIPSFNF